MSKYLEFKNALARAEFSLESACSDDALKACEKVEKQYFAYLDKVSSVRNVFYGLAQSETVDMCTCLENAEGVFQDGHTMNDVEYWQVALQTAQEQINNT